jgi:hypothetical protein
MSKKQVQVEVEASSHEVLEGLANLAKAIKANHKAGMNMAIEISADVQAAIADIAPILGKFGDIKAEVEEDKVAFARAAANGGIDLLMAVLD